MLENWASFPEFEDVAFQLQKSEMVFYHARRAPEWPLFIPRKKEFKFPEKFNFI